MNIGDYYSFKIFSRFWLVKTTHIIHHNQVLFTKFGKHLRHHWIYDVKSGAYRKLLNQWCQKWSPPQIIEPLTEKTWGQGCVIFGERNNKERNGETPLRRRKYFKWIIKQLLNSAFVGYEEFCRSRRVLSTSAFGLCGWHPPWSAEFTASYPTQPHSIIAKYHFWICRGKRLKDAAPWEIWTLDPWFTRPVL